MLLLLLLGHELHRGATKHLRHWIRPLDIYEHSRTTAIFVFRTQPGRWEALIEVEFEDDIIRTTEAISSRTIPSAAIKLPSTSSRWLRATGGRRHTLVSIVDKCLAFLTWKRHSTISNRKQRKIIAVQSFVTSQSSDLFIDHLRKWIC